MSTRFYLNVNDIDAHKRFFADTLGGGSVAIDSVPGEVLGFPNALLFLHRQAPTGGTKGTTVNHFAFGVPDIRKMVAIVEAAGYPMITRAEVPATLEVHDGLCYMADQSTFVAFTMAPDDTKVEFIEIRTQSNPIALHHIHFAGPQVPEMKAWYVKVLDAKPGKRGNFEAADLPGVNLTYSPSPSPVVGTRGRVLDHIGFEIRGLMALGKKLESEGVSVDPPLSSGRGPDGESIFVTDPWGTSIELVEERARTFSL
jgi:catechol 2,3-dioxygenase-like lactoylglutathione lyase family enzyme